jgi:hypothetical protein
MTHFRKPWRPFPEWAALKKIYRSQQFFIVRGDLAGPPAADHIGGVVFRLATDSDLEHLGELERYGRGWIQRKYVTEDKDWLFVGCYEQRIVATERASRVIRDALAARVVQLHAGQIWSADAFCVPEFRSQKISRHLGLYAERVLAERGYKEFFGSIAANNVPALRRALQAGAHCAHYVSYVRILSWERLHVSSDIPRAVKTSHGVEERSA